jgi:hypothetical protein
MLVCLCSRNEPSLVAAALEHLEARGLPLRLGRDIMSSMLGVAPTGTKADSLRRLAKLLDLSLSSFAVRVRMRGAGCGCVMCVR